MSSITVLPTDSQAGPDQRPDFPMQTPAQLPIARGTTKIAPGSEEAYEEFIAMWKQQLEGNWQGGYTQMPDEVRYDPTLSPRAKIVYEALLSFMWFKTDKCFPSQQTLAEATGYSRSTVIRALKDLYERGYIERWRRGQGDTNYYFINPLSFVRSFRPAGRGRGVRLQVQDLHKTTLENTPAPRIPLLLSEKFQPATSESSTMEQPSVSTCNTNQTNQKKIQGNSILSNLSTSPSGAIEVGGAAIGNTNVEQDSQPATEGTNQPPTTHTESKPNLTETKKEDERGAARAKAALVSKMGNPYNGVSAIATATGIPAEHLAELGVGLERKKRPVPDFIQWHMADYSRDLGDNPRSVKSSMTRATKLYYWACDCVPTVTLGGKLFDFQADPEGIFITMLKLAKVGALNVTKVKYHTGQKPNRIPAFFTCLENLFDGLTPEERAYVRSDEPLYVPEKAS